MNIEIKENMNTGKQRYRNKRIQKYRDTEI